MKTNGKELAWGTLIGFCFVVVICVWAFKFPSFHLPFAGRWIELILVSVLLLVGLVHVYKALWKRVGFWLLLLAFLAFHVSFFVLVVFKVTGDTTLFRASAAYGLSGGAEALIFGLVVARIYHVGPRGRPLTW